MPQPGEGLWVERLAPQQTLTLWATASGGVYRVEHAAALEPSAWQPCATVTAAQSRVTFVHTNAASRAQGFYRMVPVQP